MGSINEELLVDRKPGAFFQSFIEEGNGLSVGE